MSDEPIYTDTDEDGEEPIPRWGRKSASQMVRVSDFKIREDDPAYAKLRATWPVVGYAINAFASSCHREYWHSESERAEMLKGLKKNLKRTYGPEYEQWILNCCEKLGPIKGWSLSRVIQYLNSEDRYVGKLGILKSMRDQVEGKTLNIQKGAKNGTNLTAEDFLAEANED